MTVITRTEPGASESLRRSLTREQGPTDEQRDPTFGFGTRTFGYGQPEDPTNVSFPFLRRIMRDHGVAMGLHYTESPLLRAQWYFDADDARAAAFADNLIRPIYGSTASTILRFLWAGFSPAVKSTVAVNPSWTYMVDGEVKQVWDSRVVDALVYKPMKMLRPEACRLTYDDSGGWSGIQWDDVFMGAGGFVVAGNQRPNIDLQHAFWATLGKETVDGSPYGFARCAYCAPIFHMYRYIWTLLAHAFENSADPGPEVSYPKDDQVPGDDDLTNAGTALLIGRRKRSGSTIAIPSDVYEDYQSRTTNIPKWSIKYSEVKTEFVALQNFLGYLETLKLRALLMSEQSLQEGQGGSSCVTADTPVDCPRDHRRFPYGLPIVQIKPGQLVWSFNQESMKFELWPVKDVARTKVNTAILKLTLDDGSVIRATPDHRFLRRDNTWAELRDLRPGDSLMHFFRDFEPLVKTDPEARGKPKEVEYRIVAKTMWGDDRNGRHTHHMSEQHSNNDPKNLFDLSHSEHAIMTHTGYVHRESTKKRIKEKNLATFAAMSDEERAEKRKHAKASGAKGRATQASWSPKRRRDAGRHSNISLKCDPDCGYCSGEWEFGKGKKRSANRPTYDPDAAQAYRDEAAKYGASGFNHKVVSIDPDGSEDVWDLSIDGPDHVHSFVALGAVLHNSRNVAAVMSSQRDAGQASLMDIVIEAIMDQLVRPAMAINMPWYEGKLEMKTIGFGKEDDDVVRQMFQLAGQKDLSEFGIDLRRLAESRGFPMLDHAEQERLRQRMIAQADSTKTPAVQPTQGRRALVTQTGFGEMVYHQLGGRVDLSSKADGDFVASLPRTATWEDRGVVAAARELRSHLSEVDSVDEVSLTVDVQRCLYRAYDLALSATTRGLGVEPAARDDAATDLLDRRARSIVAEALSDARPDDAADVLAEHAVYDARNRAVVDACLLADVSLQVLDGPARGVVFAPGEYAHERVREVRPLPGAPRGLEVRRERLDGAHLARYDEESGVVLLDESLTTEQDADFMVALGDGMTKRRT